MFTKALRRKDVKGTASSADVPDKADNEAETKKTDEEPNKTQQGTVNLVGVDAHRISSFAQINNWFFGSFIKIIISFTFLGFLVG